MLDVFGLREKRGRKHRKLRGDSDAVMHWEDLTSNREGEIRSEQRGNKRNKNQMGGGRGRENQ